MSKPTLPSIGTIFNITSKTLTILALGIFTLTSIVSTNVQAKAPTETEIMAEIQKDAPLFTPELIQKADKYVIYGEVDAFAHPDLDKTLSKEEIRIVKKGIKRFNQLTEITKKESSQKNKEKLGHPSVACSPSYITWTWWGMYQYLSCGYLDNMIRNSTYAYSVISGGIAAVAPGIGAVLAWGTVYQLQYNFDWCRANRGYAYYNVNWAGIPWASC
jgi:hypothetical protein